MVVNKGGTEDVSRVGLMSRIDYCSDGFRQALLELAKEDFRRENVHFVVFAGGLVSARAVTQKKRLLRMKERDLKRQMNARVKERTNLERMLDSSDDAKARARTKRLIQKADKLIADLEEELEAVAEDIAQYSAEAIARRLADSFPRFERANGQPAKTYFIPSPAYDGELGEEVAQILTKLRSDDIRVYKPGADVFPLKQADKVLEVLTPRVAVWMRSQYASTHADRTAKDREQIRLGPPPDVQVIGGHGVTVSRPLGESPQPYFTTPVLHKLEAVRGAENQIGVRVLHVSKTGEDPIVRTFPYDDYVQRERSYIVVPQDASNVERKIIETLKEEGSLSLGLLDERVGVGRDKLLVIAKKLIKERTSRRVLKTWPGLVLHDDSQRLGFEHGWIQHHLRYKPLQGERKSDVIVAGGCWHAGSSNTDYEFLLAETPRVILKTEAQNLAIAGDLIEGLKHFLERRGELLPGVSSYTKQEQMVGAMIADIVARVFVKRFEQAWAEAIKGGAKPSAQDVTEIVRSCIVLTLVIPGNHDDWQRDDGHTPLVVAKDVTRERIRKAVDQALAKAGTATSVPVDDIVDAKIVEPPRGRYTMPSGIRLSMLHPGMARAETTSARLEQMLKKERRWGRKKPGSHIVIGANFHTAAHVEKRDGELGQRTGLQIGTGKHRTGFEDSKLKIVDQGIAHVRLDSINGRVVMSEIGFYGNEPGEEAQENPYGYLLKLLKRLDLRW